MELDQVLRQGNGVLLEVEGASHKANHSIRTCRVKLASGACDKTKQHVLKEAHTGVGQEVFNNYGRVVLCGNSGFVGGVDLGRVSLGLGHCGSGRRCDLLMSLLKVTEIDASL